MPQKTESSPQRIPLVLRSRRLNQLIHFVQNCSACPRMEGRKRVLSEENGSVEAKAILIAEAPGRHGAEKYGIPLHGDMSGINFETLLSRANLKRKDFFITNAVLCNPQDEKGNNATPSDLELTNCSFHLQSTIEVLNPKVIVTLGASALNAIKLIQYHEVNLSKNVGREVPWFGKILVPLYHPSPRALLYRPLAKQVEDYKKVKAILDSLE